MRDSRPLRDDEKNKGKNKAAKAKGEIEACMALHPANHAILPSACRKEKIVGQSSLAMQRKKKEK